MPTIATATARAFSPIALATAAFALIIGIQLGNDYGVGADEALNSMVGGRSLNAYASLEGYRNYLSTGDILAQHGSAYFMLFTQAGRAISTALAGWLPSDGRHLANYLTFLVGVACFYALALRLLPRRIAATTAALFATQPVLFGLGFINAKDTPFMALFLASLATGMWAVERRARSAGSSIPKPHAVVRSGIGQSIRQDWRAASTGARAALLAAAAALGFVLLELATLDVLRDLLKTAAVWVYHQEPLRGVLSVVAQDIDKTPIEGYLPKVDWLYLAYGRMAILLAALFATFMAARRTLPGTCKRLLLTTAAGWPAVLLAGATLGFTLSIRPIAGLAGLLISGYLLHRLRGRSAAFLFLYWAAAGVVAYETWPYLWEAPLLAFLASLELHVDVAGHEVLYRGAVYAPDVLPWHYLPTLFSLQLTEPVLPLLLLGLPGLIRSIRGGGPHAALLVGVALWFAVPLAATRLPGAGLYNGFRHVLFIVPPLLIACGFGLKALMDRARSPAVGWLLSGLVLIPGLWGIARLHPYEYAYFNAYAGGEQGTYGEFDQEYWCTSYREAMAYVNQAADPGAIVFFGRSMYAALPFARPDLVLTNQQDDHERAGFMLYCTRFREDLVWLSGQPAYEVARDRAVFSQVYRLNPEPGGPP